MSLLVLLQLLMFVSVHACNASYLGVLDKVKDLQRETSIMVIPAGIKSIVNSKINMQHEVQLIQETKRQDGESKSNTRDEEEDVESNEEVLMDYASPHRNPPIHNEKP